MEKDKIIKVTNRAFGSLSYEVPDLHVERSFTPGETKEVTFEELKLLKSIDGGFTLIQHYLQILDKDAVAALEMDVEPEYFYTEDKIKAIMRTGSIDEFLDMLDFAPDGVLDTVKRLAVELPLNDVEKRDAILEKLQYNVTKILEIKNSKFDGDNEDETTTTKKRRVAVEEETPAKVESNAPKRRIISKAE